MSIPFPSFVVQIPVRLVEVLKILFGPNFADNEKCKNFDVIGFKTNRRSCLIILLEMKTSNFGGFGFNNKLDCIIFYNALVVIFFEHSKEQYFIEHSKVNLRNIKQNKK